ncbi:hypothetical protein BDN70DRAFT_843226 [Pholiota conissans]|uniref:Uncharacterized protein n=1 Tax=Pholiota conissans TaxID=109636 RepID=A0A9P6CPA9_9AGAR|nr:hypothetical protein BDN70DRAFT_843226 [Pholiota conissans]
MGASALPLRLHQQVLRHCTLPKTTHRESIHRQIAHRAFSSPFHVHEHRFKAVVQNIAATGAKPDLADYNFILDQLAAVGYYSAAYALYQHIQKIGLTPDAKSFGLCFRALATRLALPVAHDQREDLLAHVSVLFQQLIADHQRLAIPMTTPNMDAILRILKDTRDRPAFESVLATAYGIDLYNPDRLALEYSPTAEGPITKAPLPFTTPALNTTLDLLGRLGDISHLVSAFEVLTQPLPLAAQHFFNAFEEDDDDTSTTLPPSPIPLPHAPPNTTTYNLLLRHVSQAGDAVLARHYLIEAIRLDRYNSWVLRHMVAHRRKDPARISSEIPAPRMSLHKLQLQPVLALANRDKNLALMRWLQSKMPYILRKQRADLDFYEALIAELGLDASSVPEHTPATPTDPLDPDTTNPAPTHKPFSPTLHAQILRQTLSELTTLSARIDYDTARTSQRIKERLGRRVFASAPKDIYIRDEDRRRVVDKDTWRSIVNFQPPKEGIEDGYVRPRSRGPFTSNPKPTLPGRGQGEGKGKDGKRKMSTVADVGLGARYPVGPPIPVRARES